MTFAHPIIVAWYQFFYEYNVGAVLTRQRGGVQGTLTFIVRQGLMGFACPRSGRFSPVLLHKLGLFTSEFAEASILQIVSRTF